MYFYEQASHDGTWKPVKSIIEPEVKNGRIVRTDSTGFRVQNIRKVAPGLEHLTLDQLSECYSLDGRFYVQNKEK